MKDSINMATGAAMEAIRANPVVASHVGGKLGKLVKGTVAGAFIAAAMMASIAPAHADNSINGGCVIGALAGGILGHQIGGGNGKTLASGAGAVLGCKAGQDIQANSEYRQQQQAGQAVVGVPSYGQPGGMVSPMGPYMQHTFAQLQGSEMPGQPLSQQGQRAVESVLQKAEAAANGNVQAIQGYAQAYQNMQVASNPESLAVMDSNTRYAYERNLNQASQMKNQANIRFGSSGMQLAELLEFEASQGFDLRPYGARIMAVLATPMSAPVRMMSPASHQQVTFNTGVIVAQPPSGAM